MVLRLHTRRPILVISIWHGSGADVDLVSGIWCWVNPVRDS